MKKILIVDDDNILRRLLKHYLTKQGYLVIDVASGQEGILACQESKPDLIISDVSMPEMDGLEFCLQLRSSPSGQLIPFIFLSAKNDLEDKIKGYSIGADDYITKPFEMKELLVKMEGLLDRYHRIKAEIICLLQNCLNLSLTDDTFPSKKPDIEDLSLTVAEARVFLDVIQGLSNKEIGEHLYISPRTVQTHLSSILSKLNLESRAQLIKFAYDHGYDQVEYND